MNGNSVYLVAAGRLVTWRRGDCGIKFSRVLIHSYKLKILQAQFSVFFFYIGSEHPPSVHHIESVYSNLQKSPDGSRMCIHLVIVLRWMPLLPLSNL